MRKILATLPIAASLLSFVPLTARSAPIAPLSDHHPITHTMVRNADCGPRCEAERRHAEERRRAEEMRRHHHDDRYGYGAHP